MQNFPFYGISHFMNPYMQKIQCHSSFASPSLLEMPTSEITDTGSIHWLIIKVYMYYMRIIICNVANSTAPRHPCMYSKLLYCVSPRAGDYAHFITCSVTHDLTMWITQPLFLQRYLYFCAGPCHTNWKSVGSLIIIVFIALRTC